MKEQSLIAFILDVSAGKEKFAIDQRIERNHLSFWQLRVSWHEGLEFQGASNAAYLFQLPALF